MRRTLTLDPELIEALGAGDAALSSTVNAILRREVERRQRLDADLTMLAPAGSGILVRGLTH